MKLVGLKDAAQAVGLSAYALRQGTLAGCYPYHRTGNRYLYSVAALEAAIQNSLAENQRRTEEQCKNTF